MTAALVADSIGIDNAEWGQNSAKAKIIVATYYAGNNHTMNLSVTIRSLIQHPKTSYTVQLIMNVGFRM